MKTPKRNLIPEAIDQVKSHEALRLFAYPDPASPLALKTRGMKLKWGYKPAGNILAGLPDALRELSGAPWTVGYGHTRNVTPDTRCTEEQADKWLDEDLDEAQVAVETYVREPINDYEYGALVSLAFNIGVAAFAGSTVVKKLNAGDHQGAAYHFGDWIKTRDRSTGKLVRNDGLYNRRQHEKAFFLRDEPSASAASEPVETVAPEAKPVSKDENVAVPTVTGAALVGGAVTEAAEKIGFMTQYSETLKTIFIVLSLVGVFISIYLGLKKRKENS